MNVKTAIASAKREFQKLTESPVWKLNIRKAIEASKETSSGIYASATINIHPIDPLAALEQFSVKNTFRYYYELPHTEFAIAAGGENERVKATGEERFRDSSVLGKELLSRVFHSTNCMHSSAVVHLFGGFSFAHHNVQKQWASYGAASFTLPKWHLIKNGASTLFAFHVKLRAGENTRSLNKLINDTFEELLPLIEVTSFEQPESNATGEITEMESISDKRQWIQNIEQAKHLIRSNAFKKIVLARQKKIKIQEGMCDTAMLHILRQQYPDCYTFLISFDNMSAFLGSTPERLAAFQKNTLLTEGLAGSISRGKTATEDIQLEHQLLESTKDRSEHSIVVDSIDDSLADFSETIQHPGEPGIKKLSNVQHLYTPVRATIKADASRTELLKRLHPTPAVGGYPKDAAVSYLSELENFERGWYAGPIGWINTNGDGEFAVAIRSGLIKQKEAIFYAGCGIVEHSIPEKEWDETNLKFIPMLSALKKACL